MAKDKTALVISAHAADFVWRCGGAIALHQELGYEVTVACLSFGAVSYTHLTLPTKRIV